MRKAKWEILVLCGQLFPALETPAGKNVPAVGGAHALAEAMDLFPLPDLGLESHFHSGLPLSSIFKEPDLLSYGQGLP